MRREAKSRNQVFLEHLKLKNTHMLRTKVFIQSASPLSRAKSDQSVDLLIVREDVCKISCCAGRNDMGLNHCSSEI